MDSQLYIAGDVSIDNYAALGVEHRTAEQGGFELLTLEGGAWLMRRILEEMIDDAERTTLAGVSLSDSASPGAGRRSLAMLERFSLEEEPGVTVYRIAGSPRFKPEWSGVAADVDKGQSLPTVVLAEHQNPGSNGKALEKHLGELEAPIVAVVHKLSSYGTQDNEERAADLTAGAFTVLVVEADTLRQQGQPVSRGLSWEQTATDLVNLLKNSDLGFGPSVPDLVIVRLGLSGFFWQLRHAPDRTEKCLLVNVRSIEGSVEDPKRTGRMFGYLSVVAASVARGLAGCLVTGNEIESADVSAKLPEWLIEASERNSALFRDGFGRDLAGLVAFEETNGVPTVSRNSPDALEKIPVSEAPKWEIAVEAFGSGNYAIEEALEAGVEIVALGLLKSNALPSKVPMAQIGRLSVIGRSDLTSTRATMSTMRGYAENLEDRPLCIAVFGPPGSGKSFAVREMARSVSASVASVEVNLAQLDGFQDLEKIFREARDIGVSALPVLFFDEFDSPLKGENLAWLKYFLAPMQDGKVEFNSGSMHVGRSILVFAGGTSSSYREFVSPLETNEYAKDAAAAKLPDFVSRLHGHVDITGVGAVKDADRQDRVLDVLRRAILVRSILERDPRGLIAADGRARIDRNLSRALLSISSLKHGARSLETIVRLCHQDAFGGLTVSSLPPGRILDAHLVARELDELIRN